MSVLKQLFPNEINAIISAFMCDDPLLISMPGFLLFESMYFPGHRIISLNNGIAFSKNSPEFGWITINKSFIGIYHDKIDYSYYHDGSIHIWDYKNSNRHVKMSFGEKFELTIDGAKKNAIPPDDDRVPKIPLSVIQSLDHTKEFGLERMFKRFIGDSSNYALYILSMSLIESISFTIGDGPTLNADFDGDAY